MGLERTSPQLCVVCSGEGPPTPAPWRAAGSVGVGGGVEVVSLGTEGTFLSLCAEAPAASLTKGDRPLPCFISNLPTNVCSKRHIENRKHQGNQVPLIQSCPPACDPVDCSPPGSSVHGILQARTLEWVAIPPPGDLPNPGSNLGLPHRQADSLSSEPPKHQRTKYQKLVQGRIQSGMLK